MKTFYCVISTFDDRGRTAAAITDVIEAEKAPEDTYKSTRQKDIYVNWFSSEKEARQYVKDTLTA